MRPVNLVAIAAMLGTFSSATAYAQQPQDGSEAQATASSGIEDIVVTARRSSESAQQVPIAITTVTAQGLQDLSVRDIIEVQKVTPGLYISSQGSGGRAKLSIRGQAEADSLLTTDSSVGVYVDGVNYARSYGLRSSLVDIARIEVLKGPQGTLFGRNTTGGALNITTEHPSYSWGGYVDLLYGSYNNMQAIAVINAPLVEDKLAIRLVGQTISREGYGKLYNGEDINDDNVQYGRALLRANPTENINILLSADYVRQRNAGTNVVLTKDVMLENANSSSRSLGEIAAELGLNPNSATDRLTAYNAWRAYYDAYRTGDYQDGYGLQPDGVPHAVDNVDHYGFSSSIDVDIGDVTLSSITGYRHLTKRNVQDSDGTPFYIFPSNNYTREKNFSQELRASSIDGVGLDWQLGLYYNRETGNEFRTSNNFIAINSNRAGITDANIRNTSKAAYAQLVYNFSPALRFTGGLRYTRDGRWLDSMNRRDPAYASEPGIAPAAPRCNSTVTGPDADIFPNCHYVVSTKSSKVTWLASVDWRPAEHVMLYGSVSTGYRAGGFTFAGVSSPQPTAEALAAAYAPFRPESVTNYELGFKSDLLDRRLRLNGAFFYQKYTNIQQSITDLVDNVLVKLIRNAAKATLYGGELEAKVAPTDTLVLNASVAYLHARYDEYQARDSAGAIVDLSDQPFASPKWTYNLGATYTIPTGSGPVRLNANWVWTGTVNFSPDIGGQPLSAYDPATLSQKGYGLLDARISWNIDSQDLNIAVFGKNLTDKRYIISATNAQSIGWNLAFPGAPRTFGIQLRKNF